MALVSGVNIPDHKRIEIALRSVFGIGATRSKKVIAEANIEDNPRVRDLAEDQMSRIREIVDRSFKVEGDLRREVQMNIRRKIEIRCFQGIRHVRGLPVNGQRSRTNARTRKGPKKTVAGRRRTAKK
ncbi:MAG: 30S ribosomal protein S13 [SAR202 cluster bacterium]|jgi:small subunit ribosomal protein S13|nr:30S ribosomal protein S13 [SAR202 cluster bacterium]|tara:strand:- start:6686 stop:7066 length:381 start_codon:yes stop_codon:yes gene_type:complete